MMEVKKNKKDDVKGKDPKPRKFSRRDVLKAGLAGLGGIVLSRCSSESKPRGDGSTSDASDLDGTVDASNLDGSIDVNVPDARVDLDSKVSECVSTEESVSWQEMSPGQSVTVGGYNLTYVSMSEDSQEIYVDVVCAADSSVVATGVAVGRSQTENLALPDNMFMAITFHNGTPENIHLSASVGPTI